MRVLTSGWSVKSGAKYSKYSWGKRRRHDGSNRHRQIPRVAYLFPFHPKHLHNSCSTSSPLWAQGFSLQSSEKVKLPTHFQTRLLYGLVRMAFLLWGHHGAVLTAIGKLFTNGLLYQQRCLICPETNQQGSLGEWAERSTGHFSGSP